MGASSSVPEKSIHEFTVKNSSGKDVDLAVYKGKILLVVNVASKCGLTDSNYTQLTDLYERYKDKGFEILAFPCNQFLHQEPGTSQEAQEFACTRYKAEYPIFQKVRVNGPKTAPVYKFLKSSKPGRFGSRIKWNFTKFLVDKDGRVIRRYGPSTSPLSIEVHDTKALLAKIPVVAFRVNHKGSRIRGGTMLFDSIIIMGTLLLQTVPIGRRSMHDGREFLKSLIILAVTSFDAMFGKVFDAVM